jgi:copper chaperone NosL
MTAEVAGRFSARLAAGSATLYFCDIGDLVAYIARVRPKDYVAAVRDFPSGEWLDASTAVFVVDKKAYATPMGWGVAAFRDPAAAAGGAALDFEALRKALR